MMFAESNLARKVLEHLRQVPDDTLAALLVEFRRFLLDEARVGNPLLVPPLFTAGDC